MALAPVGLPLECKGPVLGAVPQLVPLYEVNNLDERFVQIWDNVLFMFQKFVANSDFEFASASHWLQLASSGLKLRCWLPV